jgi:hypothetical protein
MDHSASLTKPIVAWIGLDWADQKHDVCLQATGSTEVEHGVVEQKPEALQAWVAELRRRFLHAPHRHRPGTVARLVVLCLDELRISPALSHSAQGAGGLPQSPLPQR